MMIILTKIWTFITSKAGEWLAIGGAVLASIALIRKSGADSVRYSQAKDTLKDLEIKNEIVNFNTNVDAASELQNKWKQ